MIMRKRNVLSNNTENILITVTKSRVQIKMFCFKAMTEIHLE